MSNIFTKNNLSDIFKDLTSSDSLSGFMSQKGGSHNLTSSDSLSGFMSQTSGSIDLNSSESLSVFVPQKGGSRGLNSSDTSSFMPQKGASYSSTSDSVSMFMPQKGGSRKLKSSDTSSFMPQKGGSYSATSSFMPQKGGSVKSLQVNKNTDEQVNQLISMLTSESEDVQNLTSNSTSTVELENKLRNMLQDGGGKYSLPFKNQYKKSSSLKSNMKKQSKHQKGGHIADEENTEELKNSLYNILNESTTSNI